MSNPFTPADWLASFEKVGGAYVLTGDRLFLWIFPGDLTAEELTVARGLIAKLRPADRGQLKHHLRSPALAAA